MKIVVGIDLGGNYESALHLAARLQFKDSTWTLAHSVDTTNPMGAYGAASDAALSFDYVKFANEAGEVAIDRARNAAKTLGLEVETVLLIGNAATALGEYAEKVQADLVCVQSERKGRLGSFFLGSVSRGLAIGAKHSVLVSKGEVLPTGGLNVVFATDHSDYARKCLDKFIELAPKGIASIHVLNALHVTERGGHFDLNNLNVAVEQSLLDEANQKTDAAVAALQRVGYSCSGMVINLPVNEAISEAMKEKSADLLVMGAQGHGAMHRLILGSTSLHQVVAEPHPVLILRP